jgi:hypothetical protein
MKKTLPLAAVPVLVALLALPVKAQTPKLVYSNSLAAPGQSGNGFKFQYGGSMGTGSLSGNLITLRITAPHGSTVSSITDNLSDTYSLGVSVDSGSGGWVTALYYLAGAPAGITQITVTYSGSVADWHGAVQEYSGVATSSPVDGTCSNHSTSISCSAAITTTGSNDLVVASMIGLGGTIWENSLSTITPGSGFIFDAADTQCSDADEEFIQVSAGSITPSFSVTGSSESFNIVGMAFKAAAAGTNPTGMYILHQQHLQISQTSQTSYFVSSGNLEVVALDIGPSYSVVAIGGCTPANTWTSTTPGGFYPIVFYLTSTASFSTNLHCTVTSTSPGNHGILVAYDIVGAATSPLDATASNEGATSPGGTNTDMPSVTPVRQPGIAFAAQGTGIGPGTGIGAGFIWDNCPYTGETDSGQLNNGDGWQHQFYTSLSTINFSWKQSQSAYMEAYAVVFDAAPAGAPPAAPTGLSAAVH